MAPVQFIFINEYKVKLFGDENLSNWYKLPLEFTLTRVISQREVKGGLRKVLLTQAKRLEWLSQQRYNLTKNTSGKKVALRMYVGYIFNLFVGIYQSYINHLNISN